MAEPLGCYIGSTNQKQSDGCYAQISISLVVYFTLFLRWYRNVALARPEHGIFFH